MRLVRICFVFSTRDSTADRTPRADLSDEREAVDQISSGKRATFRSVDLISSIQSAVPLPAEGRNHACLILGISLPPGWRMNGEYKSLLQLAMKLQSSQFRRLTKLCFPQIVN